MQSLTYRRATSIGEAVSLLQNGGDTARVLAGGTDLIVQARERKRDVSLLVDVKHIPELIGISYSSDIGLVIGAATPLYQVYGNKDIKEYYPSIVEASSVIGGTAIQGRASLGGNLCNSSPAGDSLTAMMAINAIAHIAGPQGERDIPVEDFFTGPGRNVLEAGEFVVNIHIAPHQSGTGEAWQRFIPRNEMDIAVVNCGTYLALENGSVTNARVALGAVAATPIMVPAISEILIGQALNDEIIDMAADAASEAATPIEDMRGSVKQRKHLAGVLTKRTLAIAAERAQS
ncbi:MAG: xanthine dehydrogenase family protein subunit M [Dehalococcoidia bacterium]|nr:xanthine dehydrogenase family protein subunit M [Dehalococcoidia bacterium]